MPTGAIDDKALALRARAGDSTAYDQLCAIHDRATFGFIRARSRTDEDAREVLQETRVAIWEHIGQYRPERASFRAFAMFWAGICTLRFYRARQRLKKVESLFSELAERFPELDRDQEVADLLAWMKGNRLAESEPEPVLADTYERLLRSVMSEQNPPHQALTFCLCQLVRMSPSRDGARNPEPGERVGWGRTEPRVVARELSDVPLGLLLRRLEEAYLDQSSLPVPVVRECFGPLRNRMVVPVGHVISDPKSRETYRHLLDRITGDTTLRDYYTAGPEADIPHWWYAVRRRVLSDSRATQTDGPGARAPSVRRPTARKAVPWRTRGVRES